VCPRKFDRRQVTHNGEQRVRQLRLKALVSLRRAVPGMYYRIVMAIVITVVVISCPSPRAARVRRRASPPSHLDERVPLSQGSKRVRQALNMLHIQLYTVWRCTGRDLGGSSEPPEPRIAYLSLPAS
jgi:hypothetical protein